MKRRRFLLGAVIAPLAACSRPAPPADQSFVALYRRLHPSVVFLTMRAPSDDPRAHGRIGDAYGTALVVGSGDWGTRFLTAKHVIEDARDLRATFGDASKADDVRVVAVDNDQDLALLEVRAVRNAAVAPLGDSSTLEPGAAIGVIGYPIPDAFLDEGLGVTASIYAGHVASIRKDAIELDVPIIPGESGGPVFTPDGKVVGLAESRFEEEHAIGFATPIDAIKPFLAKHARSR
ncbi:MAG: trypsin-like peptidase domain-containing protein [Candidatus Eremiobacteraeota bacterium]|nr:trypsin-like peptidase domain-containing protein [Candidatus Eremiobacteraeota bacterium]MBV8355994.1 trypsin-like peptidase domain-containing protein [Candidatus Eremiobacteraeota bacterium]